MYKRNATHAAVRQVVIAAVFAPLAIVTFTEAAKCDSVAGYTVFAAHSIIGKISAPGGVVGSNGDLFADGITAARVSAGGSLYDNFGAVTTTGDVTVNGHAIATFFGSIGGDLNVGRDANLTADVGGSIRAGGYVKTSGDTTGGIHAGSTIASTGTVGGGQFPFSAANPDSHAHVALPDGHTFASGGPSYVLNTFESKTLAPGSYGDLAFIGSNTVNLSSGNYYFDDIRSIGSFTTFNINSSGGPVNIFVTGSVFLQSPSVNLDGVSASSASSANAAKVYWEIHGNLRLAFADFLGTVYTPSGDIYLDSLSELKGVAIAGHDIIVDSGSSFSPGSISPTVAVPEPSSLTLVLFAAAAIAGRKRWRVRKDDTRRPEDL
jgi:hypothetical protein